MSDDNSEKQRESKFNSGIDKLEQISKIRSACLICRVNRKFTRWHDVLSGWKNHMIERMDEKEEEKCREYETNILNDLLLLSKQQSNPFIIKKITCNPYDLLDRYEGYLAKLQHHYGMGLPDADDQRDSLEE